MSRSERECLVAALDRIWFQSIQAARCGDRPGILGLRREVDERGRRLWCVRQDRDPHVIYVGFPRAFMAFWPGSRPLAALEFVRSLVASARAAVAEPDPPIGVVRLSR